MIQVFDIEESFWDMYPDFKIALSFKDLYKQDKSRGKVNSSKLMWFVAYTRDMNSKFYNLLQEEKDAIIGGDYLKDENFYNNNKSDLDPLINDYVKLMFTPAQRHIADWDKKILERSEFIASQKYTLETYEDLDKMAMNTTKIYATLKDLREQLSREDSEGSLKGGATASLND